MLCLNASSQYAPPDSTAFEGLIIETYYCSDSNDASDEDGGTLAVGSTTYRLYVDLKPGYELQAIYGNEINDLFIQSTEDFFNNEDRGEETGDAIDNSHLGDNTVALDSWVAMGAASDIHMGVLKDSDEDGSIIGGDNNDGGSEGVEGGLIVNDHMNIGTLVTDADGMLETEVPSVTVVNLDLDAFADENSDLGLESNEGAWSVLEGVVGPTDVNEILIGQFSTIGELSGCLNIQVGIPDSLQCSHPDCHTMIQFVAVLDQADNDGTIDTDNIYHGPSLCFTADVDCPLTDEIIESLVTEFEVYPNPVQNTLNVQWALVQGGANLLNIRNVEGQLVAQQQLISGENIQQTSIDVSSLPTGMYFLELMDEQVIAHKAFVKQ